MTSRRLPDVATAAGWTGLACACATIPVGLVEMGAEVQVLRVTPAVFLAGIGFSVFGLLLSLVVTPRGAGRTPAQLALMISMIPGLVALLTAGGG